MPHVDSVWVPTPPLTGQLIGLPDLNRSLPKWIQPGFARISTSKTTVLTKCILHGNSWPLQLLQHHLYNSRWSSKHTHRPLQRETSISHGCATPKEVSNLSQATPGNETNMARFNRLYGFIKNPLINLVVNLLGWYVNQSQVAVGFFLVVWIFPGFPPVSIWKKKETLPPRGHNENTKITSHHQQI